MTVYPSDMNIRLVAISLALACLPAACGEDPVSTSAPVGIEMKVQSDAGDTTLVGRKSINTESKNPWTKFVADARDALGADPSHIELDAVSIALRASSADISDLSELFDEEVSLLFEMNTSDNVYPIASGVVPSTESGTIVSLDPSFEYSDLSDEDADRLLSGSFSVVLSANAARALGSVDADLTITLEFSAFE